MTPADQDFETLRKTMAQDFHRPVYHFISPANWMNDPNGVTQWGDDYHLFYQYNPNGAVFGHKHWGHAISQDQIHWQDLPIALTPTPGGPDHSGCWSGCMVDNAGVPTLMYTGVGTEGYGQQTQLIATSSDGLISWEKYSGNPILSEIPEVTQGTKDFRDPCVWREDDTWYMLLASRITGVGGTVLLYRSEDLIHWEFLHPLLTGSREIDGDVWECPSFFPLGDKWVLIIAGKGRDIPFTVFYFIGSYADLQFTVEQSGTFDHGYLYAPITMQDRQGRRFLYAWLMEGRSEDAHAAAGWAGCHAIPRVLSLRDGQLHMEPIAELESLRGQRSDFKDIPLTETDHVLEISGAALDIEAEFEASGSVGLALACADDGSEQTRISYDPARQELSVDRSRSGAEAGSELFTQTAPHQLGPGENLRLRILLDGSVLEVIANGRSSISSRIYPSRASSQGVRVFGSGTVNAMSVWPMRSIWPG